MQNRNETLVWYVKTIKKEKFDVNNPMLFSTFGMVLVIIQTLIFFGVTTSNTFWVYRIQEIEEFILYG